MLTVAVWDLGKARRPGTMQVPKALRRVGADVVALANFPTEQADSTARACGYRHRAKLLDPASPMSVLSRFPLSDASNEPTAAGTLGRVSVHLPHGPLRIVLADFTNAPEDTAAVAIRGELDAWEKALLIGGSLGHNLHNPPTAWAVLRHEVVDLVELSGGERAGQRFRGILGRGVEARGAGTIDGAGGGDTELIWARISL